MRPRQSSNSLPDGINDGRLTGPLRNYHKFNIVIHIMKIRLVAIFLVSLFALPQIILADGGDRHHGKKRWWEEEQKQEYWDGPCQVKTESKNGEYKREIKCKDGIGAWWDGEWKTEFWDGPCKVKQDVKYDEFKEEVKCKH